MNDPLPVPLLLTAKPIQSPQVIKFEDPAKAFYRDSGPSPKLANINKSIIDQKQINPKQAMRSTAQELEILAASELKGNERRRYMLQKMSALGLPQSENNPHSYKGKNSKPRVPWNIAAGMLKKSRERAEKYKKTVQESGDKVIVDSKSNRVKRTVNGREVCLSSVSHPLIYGIAKKEHGEKMRKVLGKDMRQWAERGMRSGVGKYKDGVLHISSKERSEITSNSSTTKTTKRR
jgi:hypothetical protein